MLLKASLQINLQWIWQQELKNQNHSMIHSVHLVYQVRNHLKAIKAKSERKELEMSK